MATCQSHNQCWSLQQKVTLATRVSEESFLFLGSETVGQKVCQPKRCTKHDENIKNIQTCSRHQMAPVLVSHHIPLSAVAAHP